MVVMSNNATWGCFELTDAFPGLFPAGLRVFDCRLPDDRPNLKDANGLVLYGSEPAAALTGAVAVGVTHNSCGYKDLSTPEEIAKVVSDVLGGYSPKNFPQYKRKKVVGVVICNYGLDVLVR